MRRLFGADSLARTMPAGGPRVSVARSTARMAMRMLDAPGSAPARARASARTASWRRRSAAVGWSKRQRRVRSASDRRLAVGLDARRPGRPGSRRCGTSAGGARRSSTGRRPASGSGPARRSRAARGPGGRRGAGNSSSGGMWASVSASSGSMWTNCDDVQQAVQPPHGTSASCSPRRAACIPLSQAEKSPAPRSGSFAIAPPA